MAIKENKKNKTVLFRAQSPFTLFTAALIATLYYSDDHKILMVEEYIYDGFDKNAVRLGIFDEVVLSQEGNKSIEHVKNTVENFLLSHSDIDDYFMNTFSDCYSLMFAYLLKGKAGLHVFPEGGSTVHLDETIKLILKSGEHASSSTEQKRFFMEYPIDLELFDYTWLYDIDIPQGMDNAAKKLIDINDLFCRNDAGDIIEKFNCLFRNNLKDIPEVCFMETFLPENDYMDYEVETLVTDALFAVLAGKKIAVKPHPPNSLIAFAKSKYSKKNVTIIENADIPWELVFLNALLEGKKEMTIITLLLESTYIMTTVAMMPNDFQMNIVVLSEIEKDHMSRFLSVSHGFNYDYFSSLLNREGVNAIVPRDLSEMAYIREAICKEQYEGKFDNSLPTSEYFRKVGNLLTKTMLYDSARNFFSVSYFSFVKDEVEIVFEINSEVSFNKLIWIPADKRIFSKAYTVNIDVCNESGSVVEQKKLENVSIPFNKGTIEFPISYKGFCSDVRIAADLEVFRKFVKLYALYSDKVWRGEFWEKWYGVISENKVSTWKAAHQDLLTDCKVWIYGNTQIGQAIAKEMNKNGVKTIFVLSSDRIASNSDNVLSVQKAFEKYKQPELIIITAMNDYEVIVNGLPSNLRNNAYRLDDFLELLS